MISHFNHIMDWADFTNKLIDFLQKKKITFFVSIGDQFLL